MENRLMVCQEVMQKQQLSNYQLQSLHILNLSNTEVVELLKKEYLENPFLEQKEGIAPQDSEWLEFYKKSLKSSRELKQVSGAGQEEEKEYGVLDYDWKLELKEQIYTGRMEKKRRSALEQMIGLLDTHGFLPYTDRELMEKLGVSQRECCSLKDELQHLDPPGLGCGSMGEYFLFQMKKKGIEVPEAFKRLCLEKLDLVVEMTYVQLAHEIHASFQEVRRWVGVLGTLNPYPLEDTDDETVEYIVPDLAICKAGGILSVRVNDYYMNQYCISDFYRSAMKQYKDSEKQAYMDEKLLHARQLCGAVSQRNQTIRRMGECLLELQRRFFEGGLLRGMTYEVLAEQLEVHKSTVCRIVANKYVSCPQGILPISFFFSKGVPVQDEAGQVTDTIGKAAVKEQIAGLIRHESKEKPLSDGALSELLKAQFGLQISRRTVSNYRAETGIRSVYERKSLRNTYE